MVDLNCHHIVESPRKTLSMKDCLDKVGRSWACLCVAGDADHGNWDGKNAYCE